MPPASTTPQLAALDEAVTPDEDRSTTVRMLCKRYVEYRLQLTQIAELDRPRYGKKSSRGPGRCCGLRWAIASR